MNLVQKHNHQFHRNPVPSHIFHLPMLDHLEECHCCHIHYCQEQWFLFLHQISSIQQVHQTILGDITPDKLHVFQVQQFCFEVPAIVLFCLVVLLLLQKPVPMQLCQICL